MWREEANKPVDLDVLPHHGGIFQDLSRIFRKIFHENFLYFKPSSQNTGRQQIIVLKSKLKQARCLPA